MRNPRNTRKGNKLFLKIREFVRKISYGRVTTYGTIARKFGLSDARVVGWALRGKTDPEIPCHRVVKSDRSIAVNSSDGDWKEQKMNLEAEEVKFIGPSKLRLEDYFWNN